MVAAVETYLATLRRTIPYLIGSIVSAPDGLLIAEDLPGYLEPTAVAALAATQTSLAQRFTAHTYGVDLHNVVIRCGIGHIVIYPIGEPASLVILAADAADPDRIHMEAQPVVYNLAQLLAYSPLDSW
ncbi:roadblock/LC7 domain-containing protein [Nocardia tengchongensis]|uniref:roadblock/LC7 domain-containing protein n=1 Tax=Nocardia tengchongensis TaxID=2055889 RepID=UPI003686552E